jgi:hypothetical protein
MQVLLGLIVLAITALWGMLFLRGYPATGSRIALALYRHCKRIESMQRAARAKVNESWMRELESGNGN